ncbi:MAG: hypothetical protein HC895_18985 [Leptolyngbyaceae cyanobacterium SM1_3_5]|nr:hypothetical protein [Leptolyngbyaceae cyanobacterium SM1_3_5]
MLSLGHPTAKAKPSQAIAPAWRSGERSRPHKPSSKSPIFGGFRGLPDEFEAAGEVRLSSRCG